MNIDETVLPELTRRQEEILTYIVRAYTESPEPVSSKYLVETFNLSFSSATIRNEMAVLEELGYITAPHTSAGRVPTESGYRYFVKRLITTGEITSIEKSHISDKLKTIPLASEQWMLLVATMLARTAHTAALVTPPVANLSRFKHLELIAIQGRLVLMVIVLDGGAVHQQMLDAGGAGGAAQAERDRRADQHAVHGLGREGSARPHDCSCNFWSARSPNWSPT